MLGLLAVLALASVASARRTDKTTLKTLSTLQTRYDEATATIQRLQQELQQKSPEFAMEARLQAEAQAEAAKAKALEAQAILNASLLDARTAQAEVNLSSQAARTSANILVAVRERQRVMELEIASLKLQQEYAQLDIARANATSAEYETRRHALAQEQQLLEARLAEIRANASVANALASEQQARAAAAAAEAEKAKLETSTAELQLKHQQAQVAAEQLTKQKLELEVQYNEQLKEELRAPMQLQDAEHERIAKAMGNATAQATSHGARANEQLSELARASAAGFQAGQAQVEQLGANVSLIPQHVSAASQHTISALEQGQASFVLKLQTALAHSSERQLELLAAAMASTTYYSEHLQLKLAGTQLAVADTGLRAQQAQEQAKQAELRAAEVRYGSELLAAAANSSALAVQQLRLQQAREDADAAAASVKAAELHMQRLGAARELQAARTEYERVRANESKATAEHQHELFQQRLKQEQAAYERQLKAQDAAARARDADKLAKEQAAAAAAEATRVAAEKEIADHKAGINLELEKARTKLEVEGRIRAERENEDVALRKAEAEAKAARERWIAAIRAVADEAQAALSKLREPANAAAATGGLFGMVAAAYLGRALVQVLTAALQRWLGKPVLVRESSRSSWACSWSCCSRARAANWNDVVLHPKLATAIARLRRSTTNAKRNGAPLRNIMFYGAPGTGKTLVASQLARSCGLEYAMIAGGDVAPLGAQAVEELHSLFQWARSTSKGVVLFIDEAEAFLSARGFAGSDGSVQHALSVMLHYTGMQSDSLMLILATNRSEQLDSAIIDRMDDAVHFVLPAEAERERLVHTYLHRHVLSRVSPDNEAAQQLAQGLRAAASDKSGQLRPAFSETWYQLGVPGRSGSLSCKAKAAAKPLVLHSDITVALVSHITQQTQGFSGRQLSKLMLSLQAAAYGEEDHQLTAAHVRETLAAERAKLQAKIVAEEHTHTAGFASSVANAPSS